MFIVLVLVIMILISPELTGVAIGCIIPIVLFAVLVIGVKFRGLTRVQQKAKADMTSTTEESFSNIRTVKAFASEVDEILKFNEGNAVTLAVGMQRAKWGAMFMFVVQIMAFSAMALLIYFSA